MLPLLLTVNADPSSAILITLIMEAKGSSETSVLTRATQRNISEDDILHSHHREKLKSYIRKASFLSVAFTCRAANQNALILTRMWTFPYN
jgi:hypothetical protein